MAKKTNPADSDITDLRYTEKRTYITPAALAAQGMYEPKPKLRYEYNPHLPPVLQFDETGNADRLPELLEKATWEHLNQEA